MKQFTLSCTALVLLCFAGAVAAQDAKPYREGPVTNVSFIKTKPGQFNNYLKFLDGPYKAEMDAMKKAGLVTGYAVYASTPRSPTDPDVILTVSYPNMAALDKTDEADAISAKVLGSMDQQDKAFADRSTMRDVLGSELDRELILK